MKFPPISHNFEENIKNGWHHEAAYVLRDSKDVAEAQRIQIFEKGTIEDQREWLKSDRRAFQLMQRVTQKRELQDYFDRLKRDLANQSRQIADEIIAEAIAASASVRLGRADRTRRPIYADSRKLTPAHDAIL